MAAALVPAIVTATGDSMPAGRPPGNASPTRQPARRSRCSTIRPPESAVTKTVMMHRYDWGFWHRRPVGHRHEATLSDVGTGQHRLRRHARHLVLARGFVALRWNSHSRQPSRFARLR